MKTLVLLLLLNQPDGSQIEIRLNSDLMTREDCERAAEAIWNVPGPVAYVDAEGPVPLIDAACVYPAQLSEPN